MSCASQLFFHANFLLRELNSIKNTFLSSNKYLMKQGGGGDSVEADLEKNARFHTGPVQLSYITILQDLFEFSVAWSNGHLTQNLQPSGKAEPVCEIRVSST